MEGDIGSIRHFHRVNRAADIGGYEPILEIEIPGKPIITGSGAELSVDFDKDANNTAEIRPLCNGSLREQLMSDLRNDTKLQDLLEKTTATRGISVPSVDQATRSIIDPSTTLLENHQLITTLPDNFQKVGAVLLEYLLKYHEIGTRDAPGGHFTAMVDPETVVLGERLPWSDIYSVIRGNQAHTRAIPWRYHEVRAILQERQVLANISHGGQTILSTLLDTAEDDSNRLEEELKSVDLDNLSELVADWSAYLDTHRDQRIVNIADKLEDTIGREAALDLLKVPQEAVMHPSKWLCHLLYDARTGQDPEEIRRHGSYWKTTAHGEQETFDSVHERTQQRRSEMIEDDFQRAFQSTYEVLTPTDGALIRRWYSYKPTENFDLQHVRYSLIVQEIFRQLQQGGVRIFNTGEKPAAFVTPSGEEPFNVAEYQRLGIDPFEEVMAGNASITDIGNYFEYNINRQSSFRAWHYGREQTTTAFGFGSVSDLAEWLVSGSR